MFSKLSNCRISTPTRLNLMIFFNYTILLCFYFCSSYPFHFSLKKSNNTYQNASNRRHNLPTKREMRIEIASLAWMVYTKALERLILRNKCWDWKVVKLMSRENRVWYTYKPFLDYPWDKKKIWNNIHNTRVTKNDNARVCARIFFFI